MTKPVILTGLRANNDLTIGNYFGGMLPIIDMAKQKSKKYQINMFIPDLHSFTTPIDHSTLHEQILHNARLFVAAGLPLDNTDIHLYRQSHIPAHSELTWILDCFTGFGEMRRMTQFKEKAGIVKRDYIDSINDITSLDEAPNALKRIGEELTKIFDNIDNEDRVSVGLFNYPVLMAADILLYNAVYIPVGEDQTQHLEFTRDIAKRMNKRFYDIFTVPEPVNKQHDFFGKDQGLRIKDLADPTRKMSKSDETGKGVIYLGDDPKAAVKKIMSAATDDRASINYDKINQPGITNLIDILALLRGVKPHDIADEFKGETRYGEFKKVVAYEVERFLISFQSKLDSVDDAAIIAKLESSEAILRGTANATLLRAQIAVGLRSEGK